MEKRQMIILCTIGDRDINFKSITDIKVDRNFSDVGDKFSIDLVDSPGVTTYDLELYMNAGYRSIIFKYGDLGTNKLTSYNGTIWDYTSTFVGNLKKLTITGICNRFVASNTGPSAYLYNIDWNTYFNKRQRETEPYGAISLANIRLSESATPVLNDEYMNYRTKDLIENSKCLTLKGPGGEIKLPIPDSFFATNNLPEDPSDVDNIDKSTYPEFCEMVQDPNGVYWGPLETTKTTSTAVTCNYPNFDAASKLYKSGNKIVACVIHDGRNAASEGTMGGGSLYINVKWLMNNSSGLNIQWPNRFNAYTNTTKFQIWTLDGPLKNKKEEFSGTTYINVLDKNKKIVGFRIDGNASKKDNDVFINFTASFIGELMRKQILNSLEEEKVTAKKQKTTDRTDYLYYYDTNKNLRGFITLKEDKSYDAFYLQANPNVRGFGGAGIIKSGEGVDISWVVKQLAKLEGWKYKDEYIVQTELVPDSDSFKMQNQSAFDFIQKNLIPKAVTPVATYYTIDEYGNARWRQVEQPQGGFGLFFDKDGYLHFQPLSQTNLEDLGIPDLGYNIPNSPTISFQVNTKGTAFYTFQNVKINTTILTSGVEVEEVEVISNKEAEDIRKTIGHNDTFDDWLGLKYETVQKIASEELAEYDKVTTSKSFDISVNETYIAYGERVQEKAKGLAQNALVSSPTTKLTTSGVYNAKDISGNIQRAIKKIEDTTITATMSMWGDYRIKPAGIIEVLNMVKGGATNSNVPQKHPSSGRYLIQKVSETINASGYIQNLDLLRFTDDLGKLINPYGIDYSKKATTLDAHTLNDATRGRA